MPLRLTSLHEHSLQPVVSPAFQPEPNDINEAFAADRGGELAYQVWCEELSIKSDIERGIRL